MKKNVLKVLSYVLVAFVAAGTTAICFLLAQRNGAGKLDELQYLIDEYYIGQVDQAALDDAAADAIVRALDDEWSYYMTAEQYAAHQEASSNSYVGVGITVQKGDDQQGIRIIEVVEGGPAQEAGIQAGDLLVAVGDTSVLGKEIDEVASLIRGKEGTTVTLTVSRQIAQADPSTKELVFTVERRRFQTPVATSEMLEGNVGLIRIENFDSRCAMETVAAVKTMLDQGAKALIFDVRNNPGGYKDELVKVLDYLLPAGEIFRAVDHDGKKEIDYSEASCVDVPMAVLVNLSSYSAAEFFAAALDEYDAAVVVGEKTYGKGYFQSTFQLSDGSAVNLSIGKYYTPKGKSLAGVGLTPEVEVPVDEQTAAAIYMGTLDPEEDPQIQAARNALGY